MRRVLEATLGESRNGGSRSTASALLLLVAFAAAPLTLLITPTASAQETRKLDESDEWRGPEADPTAAATQLSQAKQALARGDAGRALNLVDGWIERYPTHPLRPEALLVQGDALLAQTEEYKALFSYEDLIRRYPMSEFFVPALERELQVATAYAHGLKRKFFGTFRIIDAGPEAQEILIRLQERLPGSSLAERAGMELADYYFRQRDMSLAAEAYDVFILNYPRSRQINKARLRLIASFLAQFKGPPYDASGLVEATVKIKQLQAIEPAVAQQIGAESILVRIYESEAEKLELQARWYRQTNDYIASERTIRRLFRDYPRSIAAMNEARTLPQLIALLPQAYVRTMPNYVPVRRAILGDEGDEPLPLGIAPRGTPALPATPQESSEPQPPETADSTADANASANTGGANP